MIRKTILGLAAGAALVTVALAPTAASAHYYGYKSYGYKNYGYSYGYNSYRSYEPTYTYSYKPYGYYKSYRYGY